MSYIPKIKKKGFCPNPIANKIPYYADSITNPSCISTAAYKDFWEEQIYYCYNGYETGGLYIPGMYYHFLNFKIIDGVYGRTYPDFIDLQYEIFLLIDQIKKDNNKLGLIVPKARRKGLSFLGTEIIDYGIKFYDSYRAGMASGLQSHVDKFKSKLYRTYNSTYPELMMNHLRKGDKEFVLGYEELTDQGYQTKETGTVLFETMSDQARKFEGEYFIDFVLDEIGEFPLAEEALVSVKPAQKHGEQYIGKSWLFGTGGNMSKGGKTFSNLWHNADAHSLERFFIPGKRYYPPYVKCQSQLDRGDSKTPYLDAQYKNLSDEELLGCEDIRAAEEGLEREEKKLLKNPDRTKYIQHKQDYPKTVEDVFLSSGTNNFNTDLLYTQAYNIQSLANSKWYYYKPEFVKDKEGNIKIPYEVEMLKAEDHHKKYELIRIYQKPDPNYRNLDIIGIDGYNQDRVNTTKSLGGIVVLRRSDNMDSYNTSVEERGKIPICCYYERPPRKEMFWEMSLKIAIYYNAIGNTMVGVDADLIIQYFRDMGAKKYLARRPRSFDAPDSKQKHDYGVQMNMYSKPRMLGLMQTFVEDNAKHIWFLDLIQDLASYDSENIGTDWDLADALGHALIRIEDMRHANVRMNKEDKQSKVDDLIDWTTDSNGNIVPHNKVVNNTNNSNEKDWRKLPSIFKDGL